MSIFIAAALFLGYVAPNLVVHRAPPVVLPDLEASFIGIVSTAQRDSQRAENDMQRGGIKARRDEAICSAIPSLRADNWIGTTERIDSNSDGKGILGIRIAPDVIVTTWNNEYSDIGSGTLLEPGSSLFQVASAMKTGQLAIFSGIFLPGSGGDCLMEGSLTLSGKLESPEFILRFLHLSTYNPAEPIDLSAPALPAAPSTENVSGADPDQPAAQQEPLRYTPPSTAPQEAVQRNADNGPNGPYQVGGAVSAPVLMRQVDPELPERALEAQIGGKVLVRLQVDENGSPGLVRVLRSIYIDKDGHASSGPSSSGSGLGMEESAVRAVQQYRFRPAMRNGAPVAVELDLEVTFPTP
jgi:hypothetical protein